MLTLALLALNTLAAASDAGAIDAASAESTSGPSLEARTRGYLDQRLTGLHASDFALAAGRAVPAFSPLAEGNLQLDLRLGEKLKLGADASLFWQTATLFQGPDAQGALTLLEDRDVPQYRPSAVVSELFAAWEPYTHLNVTVGKKRIVWGSGLAVNPTDLLNPPKDPTDPAGQRAGAWLARVELPFDAFSISLVGAARALRQYAGLPTALLYYPDHKSAEAEQGLIPDDRDREPHYALAARLYALVADTDVTLTYHFTHLYNDAFERKSRLGLSVSRVFDATELHVEGLVQQGSPRLYTEGGCADSPEALGACLQSGLAPASRARLESDTFFARVVAGVRHFFPDDSILSGEYYFHGDGYSEREFVRYASLLASARALTVGRPELATRLEGALDPSGGGVDPGSPQKFSFDPLRRHYVFLSYTKPHIADDWTLAASLVLNVSDLSGQLIPQVSWRAREWLDLSASVFVPLPGVEALAPEVLGERITEASLSPADWRAIVSVRLFF